jgi:hypothetical protein
MAIHVGILVADGTRTEVHLEEVEDAFAFKTGRESERQQLFFISFSR